MTVENWSQMCYVHFPCCHGKPDTPRGVSTLVDWRLTPAQLLECPNCHSKFTAYQSVKGHGIVMHGVAIHEK